MVNNHLEIETHTAKIYTGRDRQRAVIRPHTKCDQCDRKDGKDVSALWRGLVDTPIFIC